MNEALTVVQALLVECVGLDSDDSPPPPDYLTLHDSINVGHHISQS